MLQVLRESGSSAVFVTHDRDEALCHADKIAVIQEGKFSKLRHLKRSIGHLSICLLLNLLGTALFFLQH